MALALLAVPPQARAAEGPSGFEEVVVTARKRAEAERSVPIAITAFDQTALDRLGVRTIEDLRFLAPSLHVAPTTFRQDTLNVTIRGQRNFDNPGLSFDTAAAIYKDGVYLARPIGLAAALVDIETVEVLKGPQGTLVGRNSTGGAILYRTREPGEDYGGSLRATLGSHDRIDVQGVVNWPLAEGLALRAAIATNEVEGYIKNHYQDPVSGFRNETPGMGSQKAAALVSLKWRPDDTLKLVLRGDVASERDTGTTYHDLGYFVGTLPSAGKPSICNIPGTCAGFTDLLGHQIAPYYTSVTATSVSGVNTAPASYNAALNSVARAASQGFWSAEQALSNADVGHYRTVSATADKSLGAIDVRLMGAYRWWDNVGQAISRGLPYVTNVFGYAYPRYESHQTELTLNGHGLEDRLSWTAGLFYFDERSPRDGGFLWLFLPSGLAPAAVAGRQITVTDSSGNGAANTSYAGYVQGTMALRPDTRLTGGLRFTVDERFAHLETRTIRTPASPATTATVRNGVFDPGTYTLYSQTYGGMTRACALTDVAGLLRPLSQCAADIDRWFRRPTYSVAIDHDLGAGVLVYATTRSGYRAGAINAGAINPAVTVASPEDVRDYEVGVKADLRIGGRPLRIDLAAYHTDYANLQVQTTLPNVTLATAPGTGSAGGAGPCTQAAFNLGQCVGVTNDNVTLNARAARLDGIEWDLSFRPVDALLLRAAGSYLDAVYSDYTYTPPAGYLLSSGATNLSGTPFPLPRWQANGVATLDLGLADLLGLPIQGASLTAHYYWQSRYLADLRAFNPAQVTRPYGLLNLRLDVSGLAGRDVDVAAFVTNVANAEVCNPEYVGVLNSAPNATFGIAGTSGVLQCVPQAPRQIGVSLGYRF